MTSIPDENIDLGSPGNARWAEVALDFGDRVSLWANERVGGWYGTIRAVHLPDTPANRRYLRTLAIDWCAHGVTWCDARTRSGLPKRGVIKPDAGWVAYMDENNRLGLMTERWLRIWGAELDVHRRLLAERAAVREVPRG